MHMTKWITLTIIISIFLFSNFAFAQNSDPFISQVSSLLQTIRNLASQIGALENAPVLPQNPLPAPLTPAPISSPVTPLTTGSYFRRSETSYFDQVRANQAQKMSVYASTTQLTTSLLPTISLVSPDSGKIGTRITLKGQNFTKTGNIVYTGFGYLSLGSVDGQTLSFTITRPPSLPAGFEAQAQGFWNENYEGVVRPGLPLGFYVKNPNGQTAKPGLFFLNF